MPTIFLVCVLWPACIKKQETRAISDVQSTPDIKSFQTHSLPLFKSFGLSVSSRPRQLQLPPPAGARKNAVSFSFTEVTFSAPSAEVYESLKPLYAMSTESGVKFSRMNEEARLIDLLPPAFQVASGSEFDFQSSRTRVFASSVLMALVAATAREIEFKSSDAEDLSGFLADRSCFKPFGELLGTSKTSRSSVKERNAGFGVGDLLVVRDGPKLRHVAIWLDQDLYFEAQSFGQSVLFRVATFEQLVQELALRSEIEVSTLSFVALRRTVPWAEIAKKYRRRSRSAPQIGLIRLSENEKGQSLVVGSEGLRLKQHRPE